MAEKPEFPSRNLPMRPMPDRGRGYVRYNVVFGTDYDGTDLKTGLPLLRSGSSTNAVVYGNMSHDFINWNKNLGLLEFALSFGAQLQKGSLGPAAACSLHVDIVAGRESAWMRVTDDTYRVGFLMGFIATFRINFQLWYWAPWDCQWHTLVSENAAIDVDLIDLLIKIVGFAYSKTAKPSANASAAKSARYSSTKAKYDIAGFFAGLWNFTEYGYRTWAASEHYFGSFSFAPGYGWELKMTPWTILAGNMAPVMETISSAVGVNLAIYLQLRLDFPGFIWPGRLCLDGTEYGYESSIAFPGYPDGPSTRTVMDYVFSTYTPRDRENFDTAKLRVGVRTDCTPRVIVGVSCEMLHVKVFEPSLELSLWWLLQMSPGLWERIAYLSQCGRAPKLSEQDLEAIEAQAIEVVFEPPLLEAAA